MSPPVRVVVSVPGAIFDAAERLAKQLGISRSELYARAVSKIVEPHRPSEGVNGRSMPFAKMVTSVT